MAWPLSHTVEAYQYASDRIAELPRRTLESVAADWKRKLGVPRSRFSVRKLDRETLIGFVQEHALSERGTSTNGGHALNVDFEGFVTVPFGPEEN